ncbi:MAG: hypothetical protein ACI91B_002850 [Planctomycetota bacterium]|jgi:hypothetical protein
MSKLIPLAAAVLMFAIGHVSAQDVKGRAVEAGAKIEEVAKPTQAMRAITAAEKAVKADESINEGQKKRAIRGLNAARKALSGELTDQANKKKRGKKADASGDADGKKGEKKKDRKKRDGAGAESRKRRNAEKSKKKKSKKKNASGVGKVAAPTIR